ncbi:MAG: EpsG family protein [Bacteroidales bacterium]|nr:EpsG family protein [Bacteroidales bacterium]
MIELALIFLITILIVVVLAIIGVKHNRSKNYKNNRFHWNIAYFFSFIVLSLFLGTRDGVGVDFFGYKDQFEYGNHLFIFGLSEEIGNIWLINILHYFNLNYRSYFLVTAFITIFLFFSSFKNNYRLLPFGIFILFVGGTFEFLTNGIRQGIAFMAFLSALQYLNSDLNAKTSWKNICSFLFFIFIGSLFHYSILLFIPIILFVNKSLLSKLNSQILVIIIFLGFFINSVHLFDKFANSIIDFFPKYNPYEDLTERVINKGAFGLGAAINLFMNILPLLFYNKIRIKYPESRKYFVLYSIGISLMYAYSNNMMVSRVFYYFYLSIIFVFSYVFQYIYVQRKANSIYPVIGSIIFVFLLLRFIYILPQFMNIQIRYDDYSLWLIPLNK